jgi:hypothetical protein
MNIMNCVQFVCDVPSGATGQIRKKNGGEETVLLLGQINNGVVIYISAAPG